METEEDLWELKDKMLAAGFEVSDVIDHGFIHSIYAFDPNGIPIEFSYTVEGIDVRKNPRMSDLSPSNVKVNPNLNLNLIPYLLSATLPVWSNWL